MVYYFTSNVVEPPAMLYVGKDKFESMSSPTAKHVCCKAFQKLTKAFFRLSPDEELIKYGWDEDFHVDNLSSAHVYLRLKPGQEWDRIPAALVDDCAQLTKANSIEDREGGESINNHKSKAVPAG
ncbi:MAG: hypothetical protein Q9210_003560 [Variospora velana]